MPLSLILPVGFRGSLLGSGGGALFTPASLFAGGKSGIFYDIATLSSLFADRSAAPVTPAVVNGPVGTIKDLSGNNNHAIAPSDGARGILRYGGGLYWIDMDGVDDYYVITSVPLAASMSSVLAFARNAAATQSIGFGATAGSGRPYTWWWYTDNTTYEGMGGTDSSGSPASTLTGNFYASTIRNASATVRRRNGVQIATRTSPTVTGSFVTLGRIAADFGGGKFYAGMLIDSELTGASLTNAETWFAERANGGLPILRDQVAALYAGSVKGALFDFSDFTKMFQERTGALATTPAVVDGPVGTIASQVNGYYAVVPTSDAKRPILRQSGTTYWLEFTAASAMTLQVASFVISNRFYVARALRNGASAQFHLEHSAAAISNDGFFWLDAPGNCWRVRRTSGHARGQAAAWLASTSDVVAELVYSSTEQRVYKDAVEVPLVEPATGAQAAQSDTTTTLNIGSRNDSTLFFSGRLYGLALWDGEVSGASRLLFQQWLSQISGVSLPLLASTRPDHFQVYQRDSDGSTDIALAGTYTGSVSAVEAIHNGGATQTLPASAGVFSGTMTALPDGGGTMQIRPANATARGVSMLNVGIGEVFAVAGQSNAEFVAGTSLNGGYARNGALCASMFDTEWKELAWSGGTDVSAMTAASVVGSAPWPSVATSFLAARSVPVAFLACALGGTNIGQWARNGADPDDPSTLYGQMYNRIVEAGGCKAVIWWQGESNAIAGTSQAAYYAALNTLANDIMSDFGVPTIAAQIGHVTGASAANVQAIRLAQAQAIDDNANILRGPVLYDVFLSVDGLHFLTNGQASIAARRWWAAINAVLYGASGGRGPQLVSAQHNVAKTVITLTFAGDNLPLATSTLAVAAFTVKDGGTPVTISSAVKTGNTTIDLTLALPAIGAIAVSLGAGENGYNVVVPTDTGTPALPAEIFIDVASTL